MAPVHGRAYACVLAGAVLAAGVLAGCSSGPSASAQGQSERTAVLPEAKELRAKVVAAGVGWTASITGSYQPCGQNDPLATTGSGTSVQYTTMQLLTPFSSRVHFTTFSGQVRAALNAAGWQLRPVAGPSAQASYYVARQGGLDLRLVEYYNEQALGSTATVYVSGACFDAGSSAQTLVGQSNVDTVSEPHPTATPTPKYS